MGYQFKQGDFLCIRAKRRPRRKQCRQAIVPVQFPFIHQTSHYFCRDPFADRAERKQGVGPDRIAIDRIGYAPGVKLRRAVIMDHRDRHPGNGFLRHIVTHHAVNVAIQRIMGEKFLSTFRGGHL